MKQILSFSLLSVLLLAAMPGRAVDIALPEMGDSAGALISPRDEHQIGQAFFWRLQQSTPLVEDPEVTSYIQSLGYRIAANSNDPGLDYTFFMVPDPAVNAFAAPGGFIGVNSGLLLTAETEDELASVMAHEIAHITQRHILRSFERHKRMTIPRTAAMIAAALLGAADPKAGSAAMMAVQAGDIQSQLDYSRAHEAEADNIGMQTLVAAGFDPEAMPSFFEKLQQASRYYGGDTVPEFLRTHPVTTSRIADAKGRAVQYEVRP
jgi:predicted Zn-dependent protease